MASLWVWVSVGLFASLLACLEIGHRLGKRRIEDREGTESLGPNLLSGIVYGLVSLLLSFSFSIAMQRFDARRHVVVDEANAIGTAYLRIDLLPENEQPVIREEFSRYADARMAYTAALDDGRDVTDFASATTASQEKIWSLVMSAYKRDSHESTRIQLTPAINEMFDLAAARDESVKTRVPWMIYLLLGAVSLATALLAGRDLAGRPHRQWGHRIVFSAVLAFVLFVIADLDDPRQGLIRVNHADDILKSIRATMP